MAGRGSRFHYALNRSRWLRARKRALVRDGYRCTRCHRPGRLEVHHVKPLQGRRKSLRPAELADPMQELPYKRTIRTAAPERLAWRAFVEELL